MPYNAEQLFSCFRYDGFKPTGFDLGVFEAREAGGEGPGHPLGQSSRVGI